jgi:hypothetical protein
MLTLMNLLDNPASLLELPKEQLQVWLEDYPYCSILYFLQLKQLQQQQGDLASVLGQAVVQVPDRAMLYHFLQQPLPLGPKRRQGRVSEHPPVYVLPQLQIPLTEWEMQGKGQDFSEDAQAKNKKKRFKLPRIPVFEDKNVLDIFDKQQQGSLKMEEEEEPPHFNFTAETEAFLKSLANRSQHNQEPKEQTEDWMQDSLDEDEEVISETLALLLAQQGQKERAIKMYEALSLKFPEKNRFFAQQIEKLKT